MSLQALRHIFRQALRSSRVKVLGRFALDDAEKREQYRQLGFRRVQEFTWDTCASRLLAAMKQAPPQRSERV